MNAPNARLHEDRTLSSPLMDAEAGGASLAVLTLLWHPNLNRVGQRAAITPVDEALSLNRFTPSFASPDGNEGGPLGHAGISRSPLRLTARTDGTVLLEVPSGRMSCEVNGTACAEGPLMLSACDVDAGVVLQLGGQVVLCLHRVTTLPQRYPASGLIGVSSAMVRVRRLVEQVAGTDLPVLVLGESGTGKELVAQAIHARSNRKGPIVSVNMAAMTDSLAAADLFGSERGAYTGASARRKGLLAEAHGGTLFLDEIGDTPASVQPMLLRAIETGEFRPLGSSETQRVNVRLVAATDRDLSIGNFNQPLLRRLEAFVVNMPPLRARREDMGVLIHHLLGGALEEAAWPSDVPPQLVRALCLHDWPGNVRQLGHAVRRLVLGWRSGQWPTVEEMLGTATGASAAARVPKEDGIARSAVPQDPPQAPRSTYRSPSSVTQQDLLAALEQSDWSLRSAALLLGVSRPSLYNLLDRHPDVRQADTLTREEIQTALDKGCADLSAIASLLRTPREALRRRLRTLGVALNVSLKQ